MKIPFNRPLITGNEQKYIKELITSGSKLSGDGAFTARCHSKLEELTGAQKVLLTTSCTHALEMAAIILDIQPGDEVILPSFTFVSTANPFVLRGAKIVFVDIRPDTMNMNEELIEEAITERTRAIIPVHYAAVGCDMRRIMGIAEKYNIWVVEDAAQCIDAYSSGKHLGTIGHMGALSFHDTKNIHCGEGGALLINDKSLIEKAEIIREKGTNRSLFLRGEIDKYSWVNQGSSYLPSELNAAFLLAQLEKVKETTGARLEVWTGYRDRFKTLVDEGVIDWQVIPEGMTHNGHIFYIKLKNIDQRQNVIEFLKKEGISSVFHYVPLHTAKGGLEHGRFYGKDEFTTMESERLLRLPLWCGIDGPMLDSVKTAFLESIE